VLDFVSTCLPRRVSAGSKDSHVRRPLRPFQGPAHHRDRRQHQQAHIQVTQALRNAGHCVFAAYDEVSALELVSQLPYVDLLVTNTWLGVVDGPELMRRTRELRPDMPILHIIHDGGSADGTPPDVMHLREPFTPERLAVNALLT
jgi:CheY-like chemotaxis protein